MRTRCPAIFLLAFSLVLASYEPTSYAGQDQPKEKEKEKEKDPLKPYEYQWPTNIGGKGVIDWLKDATENPDPAVREFALKTLPGFGPSARKVCSKKLLIRMSKEPDPGVRLTVFTTAGMLGLEDSELQDGIVLLANIVDGGAAGGLSRAHAVDTLTLFGPKAEGAVPKLTGDACNDPNYETRRRIASCLGIVGFNEKTGPNLKALNRLAATLAKDQSAAVRMQALQSLVLLGPPWAGPPPSKTERAPINWKDAKFIADRMRERVFVHKTKGIAESDKQLEVWCRVVLMRFDEKELAGEEHLNAITKNLEPGSEFGPKLQSLQALALFGERAGTQIDKVVQLLTDEDPLIAAAVLTTLASMGIKGRPALEALERTEKMWEAKRDKRQKDEDFQKAVAKLKPEELKIVIANMQEEQVRKTVADTIEFIKKSKEGKPGGDMVGAAPPPGPGDKKP